MARAGPPEGTTKWMVALYAMPGVALVLALLAFALMGYAFAARFLAMIAALVVGLGAWYLASRSSRRALFVGLVVLVHLVVVGGMPALALNVYPGWISAGEYAGLSLWSVPAAFWYGVLMSFWQGILGTVFGRRFWRRSPNDPGSPS